MKNHKTKISLKQKQMSSKSKSKSRDWPWFLWLVFVQFELSQLELFLTFLVLMIWVGSQLDFSSQFELCHNLSFFMIRVLLQVEFCHTDIGVSLDWSSVKFWVFHCLKFCHNFSFVATQVLSQCECCHNLSFVTTLVVTIKGL